LFIIVLSNVCLVLLGSGRKDKGNRDGLAPSAMHPVRLCCWCCAPSGFYGFAVSSLAAASLPVAQSIPIHWPRTVVRSQKQRSLHLYNSFNNILYFSVVH